MWINRHLHDTSWYRGTAIYRDLGDTGIVTFGITILLTDISRVSRNTVQAALDTAAAAGAGDCLLLRPQAATAGGVDSCIKLIAANARRVCTCGLLQQPYACTQLPDPRRHETTARPYDVLPRRFVVSSSSKAACGLIYNTS